MNIGHDDIHCCGHDADRARRQHYPLEIQSGHQHICALAFLTKNVLVRHLTILENQFAGVGPAHTKLVQLLAGAEAGHAALNQKGGNAPRPCFKVCLGIHDQRRGIGAIGDPHLVTIQNEAVIPLFGMQLHPHHIRAGTGLGHGQRTDMRAADQSGKICLFLVRRTPAGNLIDAQVGMRPV